MTAPLISDEAVGALCAAIRNIAHGEMEIDGLEGVAVAIAGKGLDDGSVAGSLREVSGALEGIGTAIDGSGDSGSLTSAIGTAIGDLAEAVREHGEHIEAAASDIANAIRGRS